MTSHNDNISEETPADSEARIQARSTTDEIYSQSSPLVEKRFQPALEEAETVDQRVDQLYERLGGCGLF